MSHAIESVSDLRKLYQAPKERALKKQLTQLDSHCKRFISLSPFLVLSTSDGQLRLDASPRGGEPGFVKVSKDNTLLIPDWPGNNRLDSLENIVATGTAGLLFLLPGMDETLRVNGTASLSTEPEILDGCASANRRPKLVIVVQVREAYLHCAKALMRSGLWDAARHIQRSELPTMGQMIADQTRMELPLETQEQMLQRYAEDL